MRDAVVGRSSKAGELVSSEIHGWRVSGILIGRERVGGVEEGGDWR